MEDKMKWAKNFERLQEIQKQLIWPALSELSPRALIPEVKADLFYNPSNKLCCTSFPYVVRDFYFQFIRSFLVNQPCEQFLATEDRQLLFEDYATLTGIRHVFFYHLKKESQISVQY